MTLAAEDKRPKGIFRPISVASLIFIIIIYLLGLFHRQRRRFILHKLISLFIITVLLYHFFESASNTILTLASFTSP